MLNFDEFRAISLRERNKDKGGLAAPSAPPAAAATAASDTIVGGGNGNAVMNIGEFLELVQTQFLIVVMLLLDSFNSFALIYIGTLRHTVGAPESLTLYRMTVSIDLIQNVLKSFTSFTLMLFSLEIVLLVLLFRVLIIGHFGYLIDICVIGFQLYSEMNGYGLECRILNILRMWRLVRLFEGLVSIERDAHTGTKALLEEREGAVARLETKVRGLQNDFIKEQEARSSIEDMLKSYKEEVDTLNEALKIAAMDIAEVGQADEDFFLSDEDDENDDSDDDGTASHSHSRTSKGDLYVDAAASQHERNKNKEVLYREAKAMMDMQAAGVGTTTFLVKEDGKFELR